MDNILAMDIFHSYQQLVDYVLELRGENDIVEGGSEFEWAVLQDEELLVLVVLNDLSELNDILVIAILQHFDLALVVRIIVLGRG